MILILLNYLFFFFNNLFLFWLLLCRNNFYFLILLILLRWHYLIIFKFFFVDLSYFFFLLAFYSYLVSLKLINIRFDSTDIRLNLFNVIIFSSLFNFQHCFQYFFLLFISFLFFLIITENVVIFQDLGDLLIESKEVSRHAILELWQHTAIRMLLQLNLCIDSLLMKLVVLDNILPRDSLSLESLSRWHLYYL